MAVQGDLGDAMAEKWTKALVLTEGREGRCCLRTLFRESSSTTYRGREVLEALAYEAPEAHLRSLTRSGGQDEEGFTHRCFGLCKALKGMSSPRIHRSYGLVPCISISACFDPCDCVHPASVTLRHCESVAERWMPFRKGSARARELRDPAGQVGGLLHPGRNPGLVEPFLADIEVAHVILLA